MQKSYLSPSGLAPPPEPYSHAVKVGETVYIAGQVAFDEHNEIVGFGDAAAQAELVWQNLERVCVAAGGAVTDIVKITVFLADMRDAAAEQAVRARIFADAPPPICTLVEVANLGLRELMMEIDAIAVIGPSTVEGGS